MATTRRRLGRNYVILLVVSSSLLLYMLYTTNVGETLSKKQTGSEATADSLSGYFYAIFKNVNSQSGEKAARKNDFNISNRPDNLNTSMPHPSLASAVNAAANRLLASKTPESTARVTDAAAASVSVAMKLTTMTVTPMVSTNSGNTHYMTTRTEIGRLGNKLFEFLSMVGTALHYGFTPVLRKDEAILGVLDPSAVNVTILDVEVWDKISWQSWTEPRASAFDGPELEKALKNKTNVKIGTFLQSYKYLFGREASLVPMIVFKPQVRQWAEQYMQSQINEVTSKMSISPSNLTIVAIHVRRGDYTHSKAQGYNTPSEVYYYNATLFFVKKYSHVLFLISSDGIDWANGVFTAFGKLPEYQNAVFNYVKGNNDQPEKDMMLLSLANHTICSAGSFSYWAAMLRQYRNGQSDNGTTIYYAYPFIPGTFIANTYNNDVKDFFPPSWIKLS